MTLKQIESVIQYLPFVRIESQFVEDGDVFIGSVGILDESMPTSLVFRTEIHKAYPRKFLGQETIRFICPSLMNYPHIMEGGFLCFHAPYGMNDEERLCSDLTQLYDWVLKYYIGKHRDDNYEHLVVTAGQVDDICYAIHFTQFDIKPKAGGYGYAFTSNLRDGIHKGKQVKNLLLQFISDARKAEIMNCSWNSNYKLQEQQPCIYCVLSSPPAFYDKFAVKNLSDLNAYLSSEQLNFIHLFEKANSKKMNGRIVPLLLGYEIPGERIHWQALMLKVGEFPIYGIPQLYEGKKLGRWCTMFKEGNIEWAMTFDSSYDNYFGRGHFQDNFTDKNILVLGIGAVGSMVARTLVKCGCKKMTLCDFDVKQPENVCRSEYTFTSGVCDKAFELATLLSDESPHVSIVALTNEIECKLKLAEQGAKGGYEELSQYDLIFDCTTDDDVMIILESLKLSSTIVNLSITNHAKELVCGFSPNVSNFVRIAFRDILNNDYKDIYEPTGCWSPTFRASYNDIALMVQYAMKHVHCMIAGDEAKCNFILRDGESGLKIIKY